MRIAKPNLVVHISFAMKAARTPNRAANGWEWGGVAAAGVGVGGGGAGVTRFSALAVSDESMSVERELMIFKKLKFVRLAFNVLMEIH